MKKKLLGSFVLAMMLFAGVSLNNNRNSAGLTEYAFDAQNTKGIAVKKLADGDDLLAESVDVSDTYVQWGKYNGNYRLRFATAVKGSIKSIEYVRTVEGVEGEKVKEVSTVYSGLKTGEDVVYYNGETYTTDESYKGQYYWACYVIEFGAESAYKATNMTAKINVLGEDDEITSSLSKTASLNGELQKSVKLSLSSEETIKVVEGQKATLPTAKATIFGENAEVKVTDANGNEIDVNNYVPAKGENKITYTVKAPSGLEDVSKTITVFAARKLFNWTDGTFTVSNELSTDENQTVKSRGTGYSVATYNVASGTSYYAEATFDGVDRASRNASWGFGMVHTKTSNCSDFYKDYISVGADGAWAHNYGPNWSSSGYLLSDYYSRRADSITLSGLNNATGKIKFAVAREGNTFYTFVNDKLMEVNTYSPYTNVDTIPGLLIVGNNSSKAYDGNVSNIVLKNGTEASSKINELKNGSRMFDYARLTNSAYDFVNFADDGKSFSYNTSVISASDDWWQETVRANVVFSGRTVIEFDYSLIEANKNNDSNSFFYFVKPTEWSNDPTKSSTIYNFARFCYFKTADVCYLDLVNQGTNADKISYQVEGANGMKWGAVNYHVKIEVNPLAGQNGRTLFTYTLTQTSKTDTPSYSYTREAAHTDANMTSNYFLCFGSVNTAYKVSNFSFYSVA